MNNIIDLFCGCGGLSKGFEMAGFNTVLAIDFWKDAVETFNNNHKNKVAICDDVSKISNEFLDDFTKKNKITGIVGGPPCQGYSTVGKRDINDDRNYLYLQYCRIVEKVKPEFFVLENVKGLLTLNNGKFKEDIVERFTKLGYIVDYKILNSADYGVPQNRNRVFFFGINNKKFKFPDQDALNKACYGHILTLPFKYGALFHAGLNEPFAKSEYAQWASNKTDWEEGRKKPVVLHFTGDKPWVKIASDFHKEWWTYADKTNFKDEIHARYNVSK